MSGSTAIFAKFFNNVLHVANIGDSRMIVGKYNCRFFKLEKWSVKQIT